MNQTQVFATDPDTGARSTVIVDTAKFEKATPAEVLGLTDLLRRAIHARGGDPERAVFEAIPVGPQVRLVTLNGVRL